MVSVGMLNLDLATLKEAVVAVGIGLMMGLEREHAGLEKEQDRVPPDGAGSPSGSIGARTFALLTLVGWMSTHAGSAAVQVAVLAFSALLIALFYHHTGDKDRGITTEMAAFAAPLLGMLLRQDMLLAVALAVIVTVLLLSKPWFRGWIPKLHRQDLTAAVQLLIVFAVALPLLPARTLDPWNVLSPRKLGWLVALIAGVDFLGYAVNRAVGARRGAVLTGLVGGLVSSTVVTLSMARQARDDEGMRDPALVATLLACAVMGVRVFGLVALLGGPQLALGLAPALGVMVAVLLAGAWWCHRHESPRPESVKLENPFHLKRALVWGGALAAVMVAAAAARAWFGDRGLLVTALLSGFADVDPLTLAVAQQVREAGLAASTAALAVILAVGANTLSKGVLGALNAGPAYGRRLGGLLAASFLLALAVVLVVR